MKDIIPKNYCKTFEGGYCDILKVNIDKEACNRLCKGHKKVFAAKIKKAKKNNRISRLLFDCIDTGIDKGKFKSALKGMSKKEKKEVIIRAAKQGVEVDKLIEISRELGLE